MGKLEYVKTLDGLAEKYGLPPTAPDREESLWDKLRHQINHGSAFVRYLEQERGYDARWIWESPRGELGIRKEINDVAYWPGVDVVYQLSELYPDDWLVFITRLRMTGELVNW